MPIGNLILTLRAGRDALPINNGSLTVTDENGNNVFYESLVSSDSGLSKSIPLEAPDRSISLDSDSSALPYSVYNVAIFANGWYRMQITGVQLFEGTTTLLPVELIPLPEGVLSPNDLDAIIINIPSHLLSSGIEKTTNTDINVPLQAVNIIEGVYIPETITVHLGAPDEEAQNVAVSFIDYIKNVASSEIYPTWPRESLKANIIAQISLALNRIYTEWYRSRGYNFDITNSTAFDQAFVYGRNIFEETSVVVDEIFNNYLVRPNSIAPLFASYCNGTTSTCAGLSQWGTVALAEGGQTSDEILGFYYGDVIVTETDDIRTPEESYPGYPLKLNDMGESVRVLQEQLNRIAINFPQLPLIAVNGVYNDQTEQTVREFQRLFILPITGITDKATWYRISQIYSSVKRLAEITSEGQRASYNSQLYPGTPIKLYSRGSEVQEIQFYLQRISRFNPLVQSPKLDGIYGSGTQSAVISFQNEYGLPPTGIVDEADWNRLVEVYNGTLDNVSTPNDNPSVIPYPDLTLQLNSRGEYVRYIQQILNIINNVFLTIPTIQADGIFGLKTQAAVNAFAYLFGYPQNGIVNKVLWDKMNAIYLTVTANCIFASDDGLGLRPYGGSILKIGSRGNEVRYIQERINDISTAIPYIKPLAVDGIYGNATAESVGNLQRVFGLTETKAVDETSWLLLNFITTAIQNGCIESENKASAASGSFDSELTGAALKELMRKNKIECGRGKLFGLKSRRALAYWQAMHGLNPTGLPDAKTIAFLIKNAEKIN